MGQGRISFSRGSRDSKIFNRSQDRSAGTLEGNELCPGEKRLREDAIYQAPEEIADAWIMQKIERKRTRLRQISALHRERIEEFVQMLFDEGSDRCQEMISEISAECDDPQKVVEILLEPAARVIGENWCADECNFLKVTIATSKMQRLFRRLVSENPPAILPDLSRCLLLAPAPGEQHTFGLSVVDDAFRRAGWEVDCCGCDEEVEIFRLVAANYYQIMGVSISVDRSLPELAGIIRKLRIQSRNKSIVLIAGGSMVMQNPQGAIDAGFDLLAVDSVSAVALAETVLASFSTDTGSRVAAE